MQEEEITDFGRENYKKTNNEKKMRIRNTGK